MAKGLSSGQGWAVGIAGIAGGLVVGIMLGGRMHKPLPVAGGTELPMVEVTVGRKNLRVLRAATPIGHVIAWNQGVAKQNPTLFVWKAPGMYPVLDVPIGWRVVWIRDGRVVGTSAIADVPVNENLPTQEITQALVIPASSGVVAGEAVAGL